MKTANNDISDANPSILRSAAAISIATFLSRILGMVRDMVMAAVFPRMVSDAYVVAFRLPNLFRRILGEGSLAVSFIPLYVEALNKDADEAKAFSNAIYSMLAALTATLSVLGSIYMPWIMVHLVGGEGYMQIPGKYELTVFLARIMFSYLFLVTTYAFYMGVANAHKIFFLPAMAPAGFNLIMIAMAFFPQWQMPGDQLAWSVILGGVLQLIMAVWPLRGLGVTPRLTFQWAVKNVSRFFKVLLPSLLGMSVAQLLGILNVNFTSRLSQGSHSFIYFADRLLEFPQSLLSVSLGMALLPTLSELWVRGEREKFISTAQRHVRLLMVLSLPAAVGLYVLSEPIVRVIYGRGEFADNDIIITSQIVAIYSVILVASGIHRVTVPVFYAVKNTWLPAANSAFCLVVHFFVASWATDHYQLQGLVWATAFTGTLNLLVLLASYKLIFGDLGAKSFIYSVARLIPSLVIMAITASWVNSWVIKVMAGVVAGILPSLLALLLAIVAAVLVFFLVNRILRHPEANEVLHMVIKRLK
ncbi:MAG: murein biosynthesis integral membrane protein MurJ [Bdellovibrionales bacterium RBG_16_40_8]|nr:MAG: murein biosynthesis integral membrane protein MurJ [Bdellovibrionales bacterium RBG_16_40_8]